MENLETEFEYFLENQEFLKKDYPDQFVVIKNKKVIAHYPSFAVAYSETLKKEKIGTFIIQSTRKEEPQIFHSRIVR